VGQYVSGKKEGPGRLTYPNGDVYEGEWHRDCLRGKGQFTYADGEVAVGRWTK
jgi:hypothetical protein